MDLKYGDPAVEVPVEVYGAVSARARVPVTRATSPATGAVRRQQLKKAAPSGLGETVRSTIETLVGADVSMAPNVVVSNVNPTVD